MGLSVMIDVLAECVEENQEKTLLSSRCNLLLIQASQSENIVPIVVHLP